MTSWKRTLYIVFFAQLVSAVGFSVMFPFLPLYVQELGSQTGTSIEFWIGMVFSAQALTMMVASPMWGSVADRYGRKLMVERAMFGGTIIMFLMAFARSAEELVLLRALQGIITGTVPAANALVAAAVPRERSGYAMGMLQMGFWAGIAVGPFIGGIIADAVGYRTTFVVTSVLLLIAGLMVWLGVKESFTPPEKTKKRTNMLASWGRILREKSLMIIYSIRFLGWLGQTMIVPILPLFVQSLLVSSSRVGTMTGLIVGVASATGTASAIYLGRLGDRIGHRRILIVSTIAAAVLYVPQIFATEAWQLLILQAVTGVANGGIMPSLSALLARHSQPGEEGAVYGLDSSIVAAARALAPLMASGVVLWLGWSGIFIASAITMFITFVLVVLFLPNEQSTAEVSATLSRSKQ